MSKEKVSFLSFLIDLGYALFTGSLTYWFVAEGKYALAAAYLAMEIARIYTKLYSIERTLKEDRL
jgi:hypothetical protein